MAEGFRKASYGEWFTVVDAQPKDEARQAWTSWSEAQSEIPADGDVRIDSGRADYGAFERYSVRRSALPLHRWWERVSGDLPDAVRGLWFGLTDTVQADGTVVRSIAVAGAANFDADDGGNWACDPMWEPQGQYLVLPEIAALPAASTAAAEQILARLVRELCPHVASVNVDGVAVGFDDGEAIVVWERERWTLWGDVGLLGWIDVTVVDQPWKHGRWHPTDAFSDFASLFVQSRELLLDGDDFDAWVKVDASLKKAGVHMRYPNGSVVPESLLHIDGDAGWFRWADEFFSNE